MKAFLHTPQSVFLRRALFQVHLWTGLAVGLYILVISVTGSALVLRIELQRAMHPKLFTPTAAGPPVDPVTVMERVRDAYPDGRLSGVDAPTTARPTYLAYVAQGRDFLTVLADPATGAVLGELPARSFVRSLQDLHFDLFAGRTGRMVNGLGAIALVLMCATGLVVWWPGLARWRRGFTVDLGKNWKRVNWDLHGAVGIWTVVWTLMWAVTGVYFAFPSQFRQAVNAISPVTSVRAPNSDPGERDKAPPSWRSLVAAAQAQAPGQHVARIVVPGNESGAFHVLFATTQPTPVGTAALRSVYVDQFTGAVLQEPPRQGRTWGDVVLAWMGPLHVGNFGGPVIKVIWAVVGLAPALLFVTGCVMWWTRVLRPRWLATKRTVVSGAAAAEAGS